MAKLKFEDLILFENDQYVAINKPPFIASLDDRNDPVNILSMARTYLEDAQLCHRLDKETSGVLMVAKTPEAYRHLSIQFEKRLVKKTYHAVVDGVHAFRDKTVDLKLLNLGNGTVTSSLKGKEAKTVFHTLKGYRKHTLVECLPESGRMHQIRVHLAAQGAPICSDVTYGGKALYLSEIKKNYNLKKGEIERPLIKRFALHAIEIEFKDENEQVLTIKADYPKDFKVLVKQLEKCN